MPCLLQISLHSSIQFVHILLNILVVTDTKSVEYVQQLIVEEQTKALLYLYECEARV